MTSVLGGMSQGGLGPNSACHRTSSTSSLSIHLHHSNRQAKQQLDVMIFAGDKLKVVATKHAISTRSFQNQIDALTAAPRLGRCHAITCKVPLSRH